jgi:hypothetical protein
MPAGSMPAAPSAAGARSRLAPVRESPGSRASTPANSTASASASSATSHAGGPRPRFPASSRCSPSRSGKLQIFKVMITAVIKGGPPLRGMSYARFSGDENVCGAGWAAYRSLPTHGKVLFCPPRAVLTPLNRMGSDVARPGARFGVHTSMPVEDKPPPLIRTDMGLGNDDILLQHG